MTDFYHLFVHEKDSIDYEKIPIDDETEGDIINILISNGFHTADSVQEGFRSNRIHLIKNGCRMQILAGYVENDPVFRLRFSEFSNEE